MNLMLEQYLAGTPFFVRRIYLRGGRQVVVLDKQRRRRQVPANALAASPIVGPIKKVGQFPILCLMRN